MAAWAWAALVSRPRRDWALSSTRSCSRSGDNTAGDALFEESQERRDALAAREQNQAEKQAARRPRKGVAATSADPGRAASGAESNASARKRWRRRLSRAPASSRSSERRCRRSAPLRVQELDRGRIGLSDRSTAELPSAGDARGTRRRRTMAARPAARRWRVMDSAPTRPWPSLTPCGRSEWPRTCGMPMHTLLRASPGSSWSADALGTRSPRQRPLRLRSARRPRRRAATSRTGTAPQASVRRARDRIRDLRRFRHLPRLHPPTTSHEAAPSRRLRSSSNSRPRSPFRRPSERGCPVSSCATGVRWRTRSGRAWRREAPAT